jgi:hypothetical protein
MDGVSTGNADVFSSEGGSLVKYTGTKSLYVTLTIVRGNLFALGYLNLLKQGKRQKHTIRYSRERAGWRQYWKCRRIF